MGIGDNINEGGEESIDDVVDFFEVRDFMRVLFYSLAKIASDEQTQEIDSADHPLIWQLYNNDYVGLSEKKKNLLFLAMSATIVSLIQMVGVEYE